MRFSLRIVLPIIIVLSVVVVYVITTLGLSDRLFLKRSQSHSQTNMGENLDFGEAEREPHALSIESLRKGKYPGSDLVVEETLEPGSNYSRYVASYRSAGNKIYALLTVPNRDPSASPQDDNRKYPVIVFNHGFIQPAEYRTTERYVAYVDGFARAGYIVFKPDYRGHGNSEGEPAGAYGSNSYTIDVLNAVSSIKKYPGVNPDRIGMWGHSLGGFRVSRFLQLYQYNLWDLYQI